MEKYPVFLITFKLTYNTVSTIVAAEGRHEAISVGLAYCFEHYPADTPHVNDAKQLPAESEKRGILAVIDTPQVFATAG